MMMKRKKRGGGGMVRRVGREGDSRCQEGRMRKKRREREVVRRWRKWKVRSVRKRGGEKRKLASL